MKEPTSSDLPYCQANLSYLVLFQEHASSNPFSDRMIHICTALRQKYVTLVAKLRWTRRSTASYGNYHLKIKPLLDPMIASGQNDAQPCRKTLS